MDFLKRNWKTFAILLAGVGMMAALSAVILLRRQDRGFMIEPCVKADSSSVKAAITWSPADVGAQVFVDQTLEAEWDQPIKDAMAEWAAIKPARALFGSLEHGGAFSRTKCEGDTGNPRDPVILLMRTNSDGTEWSQENKDGPAHAHPYYDAQCHIHCVVIAVPSQAPKRLWKKIIAHELGHALGLDHDDFEHSVMYQGGKAIEWGMDQVTESDASLLRATYK